MSDDITRARSNRARGEMREAIRRVLADLRAQEDWMRFELLMRGGVAVEVTSDEHGLPMGARVVTGDEAAPRSLVGENRDGLPTVDDFKRKP